MAIANRNTGNNVDRFAPKLHVKKGDQVIVTAGSDKGKTGEITQVFPDKNRAIVGGLNMHSKHLKVNEQNPEGIIKKELPIHLSNLMLLDPTTKVPTRVGRKAVDGKLVRFSKKTGEIIR
jgi:large subunit ribosomal protein L24